MIVLDTTVLVYAVGGEHALREPCRRLVTAIKEGEVAATTTVEVIQEFAHVRARRLGRADASRHALEFLDLLSPLLQVGPADVRAAMRSFADSERLGAFDAVLAAAAVNSGVTALVSADRGFGVVPGLTHIVPDAESVVRLVSSAT